MTRSEVLELMQGIQHRQGREQELQDTFLLRDIGFRSLDFAELAVRVEARIGREIDFDAPLLRGIQDVGDVLDFFGGFSIAGA